MKTTTIAALQTAALLRASQLCDAALATLAAGRKTFVKGKPAMVPFGKEKRAQLKALQLSAFERPDHHLDVASHYAAEGVTDAATEDAFLVAAFDVYAAAGKAEVERRFA